MLFLTFFKLKQYHLHVFPVISMHVEKQCSSPLSPVFTETGSYVCSNFVIRRLFSLSYVQAENDDKICKKKLIKLCGLCVVAAYKYKSHKTMYLIRVARDFPEMFVLCGMAAITLDKVG